MKMAKASKEDIQKMIDFFSLWELMEKNDWHVDPSDYTEELAEKLTPYLPDKYKDSWGDVDTEKIKRAFFDTWKDEIDWRWRRVVWGCDILIDNCCDPDADTLELNPKFQPVMAG